MKKFLIAIIAIIYLGISTGIALNIHYCMGKVASVDLMHSSEKCSKCGMKNSDNNGCCKDVFKIVKLDDSHKLISNGINIVSPFIINDTFKSISNIYLDYVQITPKFNNHSPPLSQDTSLCILYSNFRI